MTPTATIAVQGASMVVYVITIVVCVLAYIDTFELRKRSIEQMSARVLLVLTVIMSAVFIFNQSMYITNNSSQGVPLLEILGWLMFDWANGLTHLAFALATRIAIVQKSHCNCTDLTRRDNHLYDYDTERLFSTSAQLEQYTCELRARPHLSDFQNGANP